MESPLKPLQVLGRYPCRAMVGDLANKRYVPSSRLRKELASDLLHVRTSLSTQRDPSYLALYLVPLYVCIYIAFYPCTLVPLYPCTIVPLYPCTLVPLYPCALVWISRIPLRRGDPTWARLSCLFLCVGLRHLRPKVSLSAFLLPPPLPPSYGICLHMWKGDERDVKSCMTPLFCHYMYTCLGF